MAWKADVWNGGRPSTIQSIIRVQDALALIFRKFAELQSARQVLLWFLQEKIVFLRFASRRLLKLTLVQPNANLVQLRLTHDAGKPQK